MSTALTIILVALAAGIFVSIKAKKTKIWEVFLLATFGLLLGQTTLGGGYMTALDTMSTAFLAGMGLGR
jgi:hypothetical protein